MDYRTGLRSLVSIAPAVVLLERGQTNRRSYVNVLPHAGDYGWRRIKAVGQLIDKVSETVSYEYLLENIFTVSRLN